MINESSYHSCHQGRGENLIRWMLSCKILSFIMLNTIFRMETPIRKAFAEINNRPSLQSPTKVIFKQDQVSVQCQSWALAVFQSLSLIIMYL